MLYSRTVILFGILALIHKSESIIKGKEVPLDGMEYIVSIWLNQEFICGGGMIAPSFILTAAECVQGYPVASIHVKAGSATLLQGVLLPPVERVMEHPLFALRLDMEDVNAVYKQHNIAVVKLAYNIQPHLFYPTILDDNRMIPTPCEYCTMAGWGEVRGGVILYPKKLRAAQVQRSNNEHFTAIHKHVMPNEFGVGHPTDYVAIGRKDTGGFLMCRGRVSGILIRGLGNSDYGYKTSLVLHVAPYIPWIGQMLSSGF